MTPKVEESARRIRAAAERLGRKVRLMEVCGTHTHAVGRGGLRALLPESVELLSGPGCPVCVTAQPDVDRMINAAELPAAVCTFGDMMRVPGRDATLEARRAAGADIRVVYSPLDALETARRERRHEVIFLAVGFETTAPGVAATVLHARAGGLRNFSILASHKLIVPAMEAVLSGGAAVDGFVTPGHVSVIIGPEAYGSLAERHGMPCVAAGFEPADVMEAVAMLVELISEGRSGSFVQYGRAVRPGGNRRAWDVLMSVFEPADAEWRGLGRIPGSGLALREEFWEFDAVRRFGLPEPPAFEPAGCRCGDVLRGMLDPRGCPLFGTACTPRKPVGPCMVSSEGACAARHKYG